MTNNKRIYIDSSEIVYDKDKIYDMAVHKHTAEKGIT